jgi:glycine oxidase
MNASTSSPDVIVVGGGIIGCTLGYELQRRDISAMILEQGSIGREASWASAGILGPPTAAGLPPHRAELAARSHRRFDPLFEAVIEDSGLSTTYLRTGKLLVARTEGEVEYAQAQVTWQRDHGFNGTWLEADQVRDLEPVIPDDILGAYYSEDAGAITLHRFTEAVAEAFRRRGGRIREHTPAISVLSDGYRVTGVNTPDGPLHAGTVVLAAGAWTRFLGPGIGVDLPTVPVKGQMIAIAPVPGGARPRHVIGNIDGGYLVPRIDGTVAVGASREDCGFDKRLTPSGIDHALELIRKLGPALLDANYITGWAGLRPGTHDETPIMGKVAGYEGLWVSTGHYRTGAQLAPVSAELVAGAIAGEPADPLLNHFNLSRFQQKG